MSNELNGNKFRRQFASKQWKNFKHKLQCRKLLGYVCFLTIYCICALSALTWKGSLERTDKQPVRIPVLNERSPVVSGIVCYRCSPL